MRESRGGIFHHCGVSRCAVSRPGKSGRGRRSQEVTTYSTMVFKDVKQLPAGPRDWVKAVWLCKVAERQMLRPSFMPPRPIRQLRDLTRCRWPGAVPRIG